MLKEKVFIPNLLDFECYWTGVIDEHCGVLTEVSCDKGFDNLGRQKKLVHTYMHATRQQSRGKFPPLFLFRVFRFSFALM